MRIMHVIVSSLASTSSVVMAESINVQQVFGGSLPNVRHVWGRENVSNAVEGVMIKYPKGSIDPSNSPPYPRGGGGFEWHFSKGAPSGALTYQVKFKSGFQFNKGGKLPGLFGGSDPRGCIQSGEDGFSARLMWRSGGAGELYLYAPHRGIVCGESIGRGSWYFVPDNWYTIIEEVKLNDVGASNGCIKIYINNSLIIDAQNLILRDASSTQVDGLLFSTFFGGNDSSWASPKDQWAVFKNFSFQ